MSTSRRRWPLLLAAVVLLVLAGALALPRLLDVERYRPQIEQALASATGWDAELGSIRLSWSGGIAVEVAPATLSDPGGDSRIEVGSIALRAAILPLLRKRLEIGRIDLWRPRLDLVRRSETAGWVLPPLGNPGGGAPGGSSAGRDAAVEIGSIRVRDGRLHVEDRTVEPVAVLDLEQLTASIDPDGAAEGSARLASGSVRWQLGAGRPLTIQLENCPSDPWIPWLGADLLKPGGTWTGEASIAWPDEVRGDLQGRGVTLLAGEAPFEQFGLELVARSEGEAGWTAQAITLVGDGVRLSGAGPLVPRTRLRLQMTDSEVAQVTGFARKLFPFPLELEPPGRVTMEVTLDAAPEREMTYRASGRLSAASLAAGDPLPPVEQLEVEFDLSAAGELEMRLVRAMMAGGPLTGRLRLDRVMPPGKLTFTGQLDEAGFGPIAAGLFAEAADLAGMARVAGQVSLDLSAPAGDPRALGGDLELRATDVRLPGWQLEQAVIEAVQKKLGALGEIAAGLVEDEQPQAPDPRADERLFRLLASRVDLGSIPWRLERFGLETGSMQASGAGQLDPATGEIELEIAVLFDEQATARLLRKQSALRTLVRDGRLELPIRVEGPIAAPTIAVDTSGLAPLKDVKKIEGLLKGLLGRAP